MYAVVSMRFVCNASCCKCHFVCTSKMESIDFIVKKNCHLGHQQENVFFMKIICIYYEVAVILAQICL